MLEGGEMNDCSTEPAPRDLFDVLICNCPNCDKLVLAMQEGGNCMWCGCQVGG